MKQIKTDVFQEEPRSCASPTALSVFIRSIRGETRINKASQAIYEKRQSDLRFSQNAIFEQKSPVCGFNLQSVEGVQPQENHSLQMSGVLLGVYTFKHNASGYKRPANAANFINSIKFMKFSLINSVEFIKFVPKELPQSSQIFTDSFPGEAVFNRLAGRSRLRPSAQSAGKPPFKL